MDEQTALVRAPGRVEVPIPRAAVTDIEGNDVTAWPLSNRTVFMADQPGFYTLVSENDRRARVAVNLASTERSSVNDSGLASAEITAAASTVVAGAEPGPACYRRGGESPTVTDADVVLGRIDPEAFASGTLHLDRVAAERTIATVIGTPLKLDPRWAAAGVGEIVEENMASAARVHAIERGRTPERCTMIAFGGAAPLHAARLAAKLGITRVLVPVDASVGSAVGFLRAPVAFEVARSLAQRDDAFDADGVNRMLARMADEAAGIVAAGAGGAMLVTQRAVEMRYLGQGHELAIALPDRELAAADAALLREAYETRYQAQYGLRIADVPVEFLTWTVTVSTPEPAVPAPAVEMKSVEAATDRRREVFDPASGKLENLPAYRRADLGAGAALEGPALVVEPQTTTLVPAGWRGTVAANGNLLLTKNA